MRKFFGIAAAAAALLMPAVASAATVTTTSATDTVINGGAGLRFTGSDGVILTVTAGLYTGSNVITPGAQNARPVAYSSGLGATNDGDSEHTVDGGGDLEALILTFSAPVKILSLTFGYFDSLDDFDFFFDTDANGSLNLVFSNFDIPNSAVADITGLFTSIGTVFGVGAGNSNDSFKLKKITYEVVREVPVPAALPLFFAGLAGLGFATRKAARAKA